MTALIVITYYRNMDKEIFYTLTKYGITFEDRRNKARGSNTKYKLFLNIDNYGVIRAYQRPIEISVTKDSENWDHFIEWNGTRTVLDNLPSKLQLLGIPVGWHYGKSKTPCNTPIQPR